LRIQEEGMLHHVIVRGNRKNNILIRDKNRGKYLELIQRYKNRYQFRMYAYCLMDNHIHLLLEEGEKSLSKIMQGIQQSYTQYFNKKQNATGHVFEQRYKSIPCSEESYLDRLIAYIHYNPVDAKLVKACD
ncbi:MAG: transposase, partial [Gallicola sp.]|nr:transposase [Gallicola sp.]